MRPSALLLLSACALPALEAPEAGPVWGEAPMRLGVVNAIGVGAVAAYGLAAWDWGNTSFAFRSEGWFGQDTPYGGADKLGHAFASSVITAAAGAVARDAGADPWPAAALGGGTALLWMTLVEVGDGFAPEYGFCWQDEVADVVGIGFEMLRQGFPWMAERVQYRLEWVPSPLFISGETNDLFSDYSGSRYILAFPMAPWVPKRNPLRYVELIAGYGTTGFDDRNNVYYPEDIRTPFVGIGLSIGETLDSVGCPRPWRALEHIQVPYTAYPWQDRP